MHSKYFADNLRSSGKFPIESGAAPGPLTSVNPIDSFRFKELIEEPSNAYFEQSENVNSKQT